MNESTKKIVYGQYFTKETVWLKKHIEEFIKSSNTTIAYDPFAGTGDLLKVAHDIGYTQLVGMDIDHGLSWKYNDSLITIPYLDDSIIITNPPYISNYSASRKKVDNYLMKYFENSIYSDVYLIALDKMLTAADYVVAIIPETFINSNYQQKDRLVSLTILEDNPFNDTDTPVLVACFDKHIKSLEEVKVYKNDKYINTLGAIESMRLYPQKNLKIIFNDKDGWLGVRCVDSTNPEEMLRFDFKNNIEYDWDNGIKVSSRLLTLIEIDIALGQRQNFIDACNEILNTTREITSDIIFSPFKGNMKNGRRRRRLDFSTCRAIIEKAYYKTMDYSLGGLFNEN